MGSLRFPQDVSLGKVRDNGADLKRLGKKLDGLAVRNILNTGLFAVALSAMTNFAVAADLGPVTNLPMPRFVSMKASEGNVRRGPSLSHRIDWVYKRRNMPLMIVGEYGHWRQVRDRDGVGGWVHYSLLSGVRTVIVEEDMAALRAKPSGDAPVRAHTEMGVIARLDACTLDWCAVSADGYRGWIEKTRLWGVKPGEIRD